MEAAHFNSILPVGPTVAAVFFKLQLARDIIGFFHGRVQKFVRDLSSVPIWYLDIGDGFQRIGAYQFCAGISIHGFRMPRGCWYVMYTLDPLMGSYDRVGDWLQLPTGAFIF
jgi:hypothetical protein